MDVNDLVKAEDAPQDEYSLLSKSPSPDILDSTDTNTELNEEVAEGVAAKNSSETESYGFPSTTTSGEDIVAEDSLIKENSESAASSDNSDIVMVSNEDIPDINSMGESISVPYAPEETVQEVVEEVVEGVEQASPVEESMAEESVEAEIVPAELSKEEVDSEALAEELISQIEDVKELVPEEEQITLEADIVPDVATPTPEEVPAAPLEAATPTPPTETVNDDENMPDDVIEDAPREDFREEIGPPISPCELVSIPVVEESLIAATEAAPEIVPEVLTPEEAAPVEVAPAEAVPVEVVDPLVESVFAPDPVPEIIPTASVQSVSETVRSNDDDDDNLPDDVVIVEKAAESEPVTVAEPVAAATEPEVEEKKDEWIDVLGNGQLKKRTKVEGTGERLEKGEQVTIIYSLTLTSGKTIDDKVEQTFQLGDGEVISAIDLTANLSKVGETYEVVAMSRFAYDTLGRPPAIGSNCSVLLEIEVTKSEPTPKLEDMSEAERINVGDRKRKIGNDYFSRNDFTNASLSYNGAIYYLDPPSYKVSAEPSEDLKELQFKSWCNLAISDLKNAKLDPGLRAANRALEIQPGSTKAMYRKAKLLVEKGSYAEAQTVLQKACELDPKSPGCKAFLKELAKKMSSQKKKEKAMYQKMFNLEDKEGEAGGQASSSDETSWTAGLFPMVAASVAIGSLAVAAWKMLND